MVERLLRIVGDEVLDPFAGSVALDGDPAIGQVAQAAREAQHIEHRPGRLNLVGAGGLHLADHQHALRPILVDGDGDLGVLHVLLLLQARFDRPRGGLRRQSGNMHIAEENQGNIAVVGHPCMLVHLRGVEDLDVQHVAGPDQQALGRGGGWRRGRGRGRT